MGKKDAERALGPAPHLDDGKQLERVRRICFAIAGTVEKLSHGAPTFFTPERVYAMFVDNHHDDGHVAVWLPAAPGVQQELIEEDPATYFRPPYVGVSGWVGNQPDGTVYAEFEGPPDAVEAVVAWCHAGSSRSTVTRVDVTPLDPTGDTGFSVH